MYIHLLRWLIHSCFSTTTCAPYGCREFKADNTAVSPSPRMDTYWASIRSTHLPHIIFAASVSIAPLEPAWLMSQLSLCSCCHCSLLFLVSLFLTFDTILRWTRWTMLEGVVRRAIQFLLDGIRNLVVGHVMNCCHMD